MTSFHIRHRDKTRVNVPNTTDMCVYKDICELGVFLKKNCFHLPSRILFLDVQPVSVPQNAG